MVTAEPTAEVEPRKPKRGRAPIYRTPEQIAAAAADRAARKKARLEAPLPDEDPNFVDLTLEDIRHMRRTITEEETRVSYWRRLVQARLDLLNNENLDADPITDLSRVLADAKSSQSRIARISVGPVEGAPPLPDLAALWSKVIDPNDPVACDQLREGLENAEKLLSAYRRDLHARLDKATGQLIVRYRRDPMLALTALPGYEYLMG